MGLRPRLDGFIKLNLNREPRKPATFEDTLKQHLAALATNQEDSLRTSFGLDETQYEVELKKFQSFMQRHMLEGESAGPSSTKASLERVFMERGPAKLDTVLRQAFVSQVVHSQLKKSDISRQHTISDLRYPLEWFPMARTLQRTIHLHVGPTNSGKTYEALKRLESAERGVYAGPLRLLAHEVYTRLKAKGKACSLVTGDERKLADDAGSATASQVTSCTVEMVPLSEKFDVAVIDEIQMLGSSDRGWAWTQALLGIRAKELHLCGEERTVPLIRDLAVAMGDKLEIHQYQRLSPLKTMQTSLKGQVKTLRKGDCVVVFSRLGIHAMKKEIEEKTNKRCAVVYGNLPPETRAQQARLFNDPDNDYDYLVASDAVGMGLNLSIKRIIFESTSKYDGADFRTLPISEIKQIAGRAGRYRTAAQDATSALEALTAPSAGDKVPEKDAAARNVGYVTTLEASDLPIVQHAMTSDPAPMPSAGVLPPTDVLLRFASYFPPGTPLSYVLLRLHEVSRLHPRFHLCTLKDQLAVADLIEPVTGLTVLDRLTFCASPASLRDPGLPGTVVALARCVGEGRSGALLDVPALRLELLDRAGVGDKAHLRALESLHKGLVLYLWLSYRFAGVFSTRAMAEHVKAMVERRIDDGLDAVGSFRERARLRHARAARQHAVIGALKQRAVQENVAQDEGRAGESASPGIALPLQWGAAEAAREDGEPGVGCEPEIPAESDGDKPVSLP